MTESPPLREQRGHWLTGFIAGLFLLYAAQALVGLVLETRYSAVSSSAYSSVSSIQGSGIAALRAFHYWGSALLIGLCFAAMIAMLIARWFNGGHNRIWLATGLLFLTSLLSQISGNLLPFDRHGVETAVIESGVAARAPIAGSALARAILGGEHFNDSTVSRWHLGHLGLAALGIMACALFLTGRRSQAIRATAWIPPGLALALAALIEAPLGTAATRADYGSFDAQVSWYTWPVHGSLNLFSRIGPGLGWIGSVAIPGLFALFMVGAPWLARRFRPVTLQVVFFGFCAYFLTAGVFFGGRFAPLVGARGPAQTPAVAAPRAGPVNRTLYAQGRLLFNKNACMGCHGKDGRKGDVGPSLLGIAGRHGIDPAWYMGFIKNPQAEKPNSMMPPFPELGDAERRAIAEFLIHQK